MLAPAPVGPGSEPPPRRRVALAVPRLARRTTSDLAFCRRGLPLELRARLAQLAALQPQFRLPLEQAHLLARRVVQAQQRTLGQLAAPPRALAELPQPPGRRSRSALARASRPYRRSSRFSWLDPSARGEAPAVRVRAMPPPTREHLRQGRGIHA